MIRLSAILSIAALLFTIVIGATGALAKDDGLTRGMPQFDVMGITLGMDGDAAVSALAAKGWKLQPLTCPSGISACLTSVDKVEDVYQLKTSFSYHFTFLLLSDTDPGAVTIKLGAPVAPDMKQRVAGIQYESYRDIQKISAAVANQEWKAGLVEKALNKYGRPDNPYSGFDYKGQDACSTGYPDYDLMEWYSTETDRDSLTISRYLLQIQTAVNCRQAFSIILLDQVAKNITDAQLGLIADYMMHKAGAGAPAAKTPDF